MLGDRNTFKPVRFTPEGVRGLDGDPVDRAQDHFGNLIDNPTLVASYNVTNLPRFPIAVEVRASGGIRVDALHGVRVALGWDGAQTWEASPIEIKPGGVASLEVPMPKGGTLEVWADATSPIETDASEIDTVTVLSLAEARERAKDRGTPPPLDPKDPLGLKGLGLGLALVAIVAAAVWVGFGKGAAS